jgi:hypothetical protein
MGERSYDCDDGVVVVKVWWLTLSRVFPAGLVLDPEFLGRPSAARACQELPRSGAGLVHLSGRLKAGKPQGSEAHPRNAVCGIASEGKEKPKR